MSLAGLVSVVVIGRNEGARLERCLRSVAAMERQGFDTETVYVDSGSSDNSIAIAERVAASSQTGCPDGASAACGSDKPSASATT